MILLYFTGIPNICFSENVWWGEIEYAKKLEELAPEHGAVWKLKPK